MTQHPPTSDSPAVLAPPFRSLPQETTAQIESLIAPASRLFGYGL